jgi:hypothetical protein
MATTFNLEEYTRQHESLPDVLWRVTHSNSQHVLYPATGDIWAKDLRVIADEGSLKQAAANHFDWYCAEPSCFLSAFTDEAHALGWARRLHNKGDKKVYTTQIVTAMLPAETRIFDATSLSNRLGIRHPYSKHEVIFLHRIPWQALGHPRKHPRKLDVAPGASAKEDSVQVPALVQSLQELNDTVGHSVSARNIAYRLINVITGVTHASKVRGKDYQASMRGVVVAMVEALSERPAHAHAPETDSRVADPFIELSRILCKNDKDREALLLKLAECITPRAPTPSPQLKTASEVRRERALQRTKPRPQISARLVNILPRSAVMARGLRRLTPRERGVQPVVESGRSNGADVSKDSTSSVEPVTGAEHSLDHQPVPDPRADGSGEVAAASYGVLKLADTAIPDITGLTLQED